MWLYKLLQRYEEFPKLASSTGEKSISFPRILPPRMSHLPPQLIVALLVLTIEFGRHRLRVHQLESVEHRRDGRQQLHGRRHQLRRKGAAGLLDQ